MLRIDHTGHKEYVAEIPSSWNNDDENWQDLIMYFQDCFVTEGTIYLNMSNITHLTSYAFNRLFDLTSVAAEHLCRLIFMNVAEDLEEKIAMLNHQSE